MTVELDYEGATSFVSLVRAITHWHRHPAWPGYVVAEISMVEQVEVWLPDGIELLEWREEPSDDEPRSALLGRRV